MIGGKRIATALRAIADGLSDEDDDADSDQTMSPEDLDEFESELLSEEAATTEYDGLPAVESDSALEQSDTELGQTYGRLPSPIHADVVGPSSARLESDRFRTGDLWTSTFAIQEFPGETRVRMLEELFAATGTNVDIALHLDPSRESDEAINHLEHKIGELQEAMLAKENRGETTTDTELRLSRHQMVHEQLISGDDGVVDVGTYVTARAETEEYLMGARGAQGVIPELQKHLRTKQLTPKTADYRQQDGLVSTSPIAHNKLDRSTLMLGRGAGALWPFGWDTVFEEDGFLLGYHAMTGSPIVVDRYNQTAYNVLILGEIGSGKSFTTKLNILRRQARETDTVVIVIDPMGGFHALRETLQGEHIPINGTKSLNPLEIEAIPEDALERLSELNHDPYRQTLATGIEFFDTFHVMESDEEMGLSPGQRTVLELAMNIAYARNGITRDPTTHGNESPTPLDVYQILGEIVHDPLPFLLVDDVDSVLTPEILEEFDLATPIIEPSQIDELMGAITNSEADDAITHPEDEPTTNDPPATTAPTEAAQSLTLAVTELSGIGSVYGDRLIDAGFGTVSKLADASPQKVAAEIDAPETIAREWIEDARQQVAITADGGADQTTNTGQQNQNVSDRGGNANSRDSQSSWRIQTNLNLTGVTVAEKEITEWEELAIELRLVLRQLKLGHRYDHLAQPTDIDVSGSNFVYLDLEESESSHETGMMMKLLLDHIDTFAKKTDKNVILAIDEAHMLLQDTTSADWLERRVRHSRHFNLSIQLMTQSANDILDEHTAQIINENVQMKIFHQLDLSDEQFEYLELADSEKQYVENATMGEDGKGFTTALLEVQGKGRYPLLVSPLPGEIPFLDPGAEIPALSDTDPESGL